MRFINAEPELFVLMTRRRVRGIGELVNWWIGGLEKWLIGFTSTQSRRGKAEFDKGLDPFLKKDYLGGNRFRGLIGGLMVEIGNLGLLESFRDFHYLYNDHRLLF